MGGAGKGCKETGAFGLGFDSLALGSLASIGHGLIKSRVGASLEHGYQED
jgi:hypothetical protein